MSSRWNRATRAILTYLIRNVRFVGWAWQPSNPNQEGNRRWKTYRGIPRSLRSCSFDYSTVNPICIYIRTRGEHLQNLTGWSLTRETRCISISISSMVVVVIGLIASRRRHAKRLPDWTLLYQHRENFIAGHVSTVRISCSLGISICIAPREIACRAFSDRHVYLFHLTFSFFFFLTRGVAAFFNPFHRRRKEIADNHLGPASSNVYTKSNSF